MVAKSPRIGVGPGFDSQGSVTLFHKYCFPNLYWIHWAITMWSDSAMISNNHVKSVKEWASDPVGHPVGEGLLSDLAQQACCSLRQFKTSLGNWLIKMSRNENKLDHITT